MAYAASLRPTAPALLGATHTLALPAAAAAAGARRALPAPCSRLSRQFALMGDLARLPRLCCLDDRHLRVRETAVRAALLDRCALSSPWTLPLAVEEC